MQGSWRTSGRPPELMVAHPDRAPGPTKLEVMALRRDVAIDVEGCVLGARGADIDAVLASRELPNLVARVRAALGGWARPARSGPTPGVAAGAGCGPLGWPLTM